MSLVKHRWRSKWTALLVGGALLASIISPALPAARAEEAASAARTAQYSDLASSYAAKEIAALTASGILDGFDDGTFRPAEPVTRAQFAKVIASILKLKPVPEIAARFHDVPSNAWYAGYTGALVKEGITDGVSEHEFAPDQLVTREELAAFFMRALTLSKSAQSFPLDSSIFADFNDISPWAQHYVSFAYQIGFLQGTQDANNSLVYRPKAQADRQALARLAFELLENKDTYLDKAAGLTTPAASVSPTPSPSPSTGFMGGGGGGFGGGGGGGPTPSPTPAATPTPGPADGSTLTDLPAGNYTGSFTVAAGVTVFGPETGTAVISGKLLVNPGPSGELILRNVEAAVIHILSGSDHSVILQNVRVTDVLLVNTGNQGTPVRVLSQTGTAIHTTLVESAAILEVSGGSAGEVVIQSHATGKTVELRGSINGTVRSTAPDAFILIRDGASVQSLIMEANGRVQADGNVSGYGILNSNVQVNLSGSKLAVLKENTGKSAKTSIQSLGDPSKLVLADQAKVLEAMSQYNALTGMNMADTISQQLKDQLQAAQNKMKALTKEEAEKRLKDLSSVTSGSRPDMEKNFMAVQSIINAALSWGTSEWEIAGYQNWYNVITSFEYTYLSVSTGNYTGDMAVLGNTLPGMTISLDKTSPAANSASVTVGEMLANEGRFLFTDPHSFPAAAGDIFTLTVHNPQTGFSLQKKVTVSNPQGATVVPTVQPYHEGDYLELNYSADATYDYQFVLVLNSKGQAIFSGTQYSQTETVLFSDSLIKPAAGETLTLYARSIFYLRGTSKPVTFQVLPNSGDSAQPEFRDLYAGDFLVNVTANPGALVTLTKDRYTFRKFADWEGQALFELPYTRLNLGEQVSVTAKELGKHSVGPVTKLVKPTSGKSVTPAATVQETGGSIAVAGTFPNNSTLLLQWGTEGTGLTRAFQLGESPTGSVSFSESFLSEGNYSDKLYIYVKTPGKAISDPQIAALTASTKLSAIEGYIYTDSVNVKVTSEPGSVVTLKKQDGTVVFQEKGNTDSNVILLDSMLLKTKLISGERVYLTSTAPGKHQSFTHEMQVLSNEGKTPKPVIRGILFKKMEQPVLSILSESFKFGVRLQSPDGTKSGWFSPDTGYGGQYPIDKALLNSGISTLLVSIKEHGKETSDPVEVPIYDSPISLPLTTVTETVYKSVNSTETITGYTNPFAMVTIKSASGQTLVEDYAGILGSFALNIPSSLLMTDTRLYVSAADDAKGLLSSETVSIAVYAAQGTTPIPVAPAIVNSGGNNVKLELEAPSGSYVTIYDQNGILLDSGYWKGTPSERLEKSIINFELKQLNQTLRIAARLPGRNQSEFIEVYIQEDPSAAMSHYPSSIKTSFDYPGGMTRISGYTDEPFTLIKDGYSSVFSDAAGKFEMYMKSEPGQNRLSFEAPGKTSILYYVFMYPGTIYSNDSGGSSGGTGGGGSASFSTEPGK